LPGFPLRMTGPLNGRDSDPLGQTDDLEKYGAADG
jgi:hypothetical protein